MLGKLLGKKSGFYLELPEDEIAAIPEVAATPAPQAQPAPQAVAAPQAQAESAAKPETTTAAPNATKAPAATKASKKEAPAAPAAVVTTPITDTQELIRTAIAAAANRPAPVEEPPTPTFTDYVPKPIMSRRRPGPSMSSFQTMAKEMKASKSGF